MPPGRGLGPSELQCVGAGGSEGVLDAWQFVDLFCWACHEECFSSGPDER